MVTGLLFFLVHFQACQPMFCTWPWAQTPPVLRVAMDSASIRRLWPVVPAYAGHQPVPHFQPCQPMFSTCALMQTDLLDLAMKCLAALDSAGALTTAGALAAAAGAAVAALPNGRAS